MAHHRPSSKKHPFFQQFQKGPSWRNSGLSRTSTHLMGLQVGNCWLLVLQSDPDEVRRARRVVQSPTPTPWPSSLVADRMFMEETPSHPVPTSPSMERKPRPSPNHWRCEGPSCPIPSDHPTRCPGWDYPAPLLSGIEHTTPIGWSWLLWEMLLHYPTTLEMLLNGSSYEGRSWEYLNDEWSRHDPSSSPGSLCA